MSTNDSKAQKSDAVSLADEEGVKQVLVSSVLGLWDVVNNLTRLATLQARPLSGYDLRFGAGAGGNVRLRRDQAGGRRPGRDGLRHYHRRRPGADAGRQRGRRHRAGTCPVSRDRVDLPFEQESMRL